MALVFDNIKAIPQTHVFIVGIGGYPYLKDGLNAVQQEDDFLNELGQLTSPQASVEAFYKLVMEFNKNNEWITPLGSIELLLSPAAESPPVLNDIEKVPATRQNIETSYYVWKDRCDAHEDNVAIFFFCGHGLEKGQHFLLAEDFGKNSRNPWSGAFAFDKTRTAFFSCKAKTQLFFVDACRQFTPDMITRDLTAAVSAIDNPDISNTESLYNLTMKASAANESAYGKKDKPSFFTQALSKGLTGWAASNPDDEWTISTGALSSGINLFLRLIEPSQGYQQRCISYLSDTTNILKLKNTPKVKLRVCCIPDDALQFAALSYQHTQTGVRVERTVLEPTPWDIDELEAGIYDFEARFERPPYMARKIQKSVAPPNPTAKLNCL